MAAKVGYFLRLFRLESVRHTRAGNEYDRKSAIEVLSRHTPTRDISHAPPGNHSHPSHDSQANHSRSQDIENEGPVNGVNTVNGFTQGMQNINAEAENHPNATDGMALPDDSDEDDTGWRMIR